MFEHISSYQKPKVKQFLRYLANSASRHEIREKTDSARLKKVDWTPLTLLKNTPDVSEEILDPHFIDENRVEELETKIKVYFTKNKYLPFEMRLKKVQNKIRKLGKKDSIDKRRLQGVETKLKRCELLIQKLRRAKV
ncbi:hypothetical protein JXC34_04550 [Candidatus Woesearchaeota archaeon]|nr:hypothetical protein [Candidatus Woesearchaeota archaeon]